MESSGTQRVGRIPRGTRLVEEVKMKKIVVVLALFSIVGVTDAQLLKKGNLVGTHTLTVKLEPGVTMEQFTDFYVKKLIPEFERYRPGWKVYPVKRIRGEKANGLAIIIVIDSEANRDKFYNTDGSPSELGKATNAKLQPINEAMQRLGTITADVYTDWLVY